jgi:hypothetical protein
MLTKTPRPSSANTRPNLQTRILGTIKKPMLLRLDGAEQCQILPLVCSELKHLNNLTRLGKIDSKKKEKLQK